MLAWTPGNGAGVDLGEELNVPSANRVRIARVVIAAVAAFGLVVGSALPASAAQSHNGLDPLASGCANGASTIATFAMKNPTSGSTIALAEVRYSPACQTNWVRVTNPYPSGTVTLTMVITAQNGNNTGAVTTANGQHWSPMVYAPGSTCIMMSARMTQQQGAYVVAESGIKTVC